MSTRFILRASLLASILSTAVLTSCGGTGPSAVATTTPEVSRRPRVIRADVTAPAFPPMETQLRDDSLLILRGGRRLLLGQNEVSNAELDFASPVIALAELDHTFLYLTADGTLYSTGSGGPLARPTPVASTELQRLSTLGPSRGRIVVLAGDLVGDLYSSDGGELVKAPLPARSVIGATFTDSLHGCVLLFDGTGRYTDDGGTTYRIVPGLARAFALDLHHGSCRYSSGTHEEPVFQTIDATGDGVEYEPGDDSDRDGVYPYRPAELYLSRGSMARIGRTRAVAIGPEPTTVQVFSLEDGRRLGAYPDALPPSCTLIDAGDAAVAVCTPEGEDGTAWITRDGGSFTQLTGLGRVLAVPGAQLHGSDDGQLAWTGACEDDPSIASGDDTICVLRNLETGAHESIMISEHGVSAIRGLAGDWLLLETLAGERYWLAHLGTEETVDVSVPGTRSLLEVELASDGTLVVFADHADGAKAVYLGTPGGELVRRSIPEAAVDVSFQTIDQGIAAGRTMRDVFRTRDGGQTWSPMVISLEGDASRTPLLDPERYLECHRNYCLGFSWRAGRGRAVVVRVMAEDEPPRTLASTGPDRLGDEPRAGLVLPTSLRCELMDGVQTLERPAPLATGATSRIYGDDRFTAWIDEVPRGRRSFMQVHWRGTDGEGAYQLSSRLADSNASRGATIRTDVVSVSRHGALLNVCSMSAGPRECRFAIVPPNGVPMLLDGAEPHTATHGQMVARFTVRDLFFVVAPNESGPVVFLFDPIQGSASHFAVGEAVGEAFAGVADTALGPYFVLTDRGARLWQAVVEQDEGVSFPAFAAITDTRLSICTREEASAEVRWPGHVQLRIGDETIEGNGFAEVALSDGPACVRRYVLASDPVFGQFTSNADGRFEGFVERGTEGLRRVRCSLR